MTDITRYINEGLIAIKLYLNNSKSIIKNTQEFYKLSKWLKLHLLKHTMNNS